MSDPAFLYSIFTLLALGVEFLLGAGAICLIAGFLLRKTRRKMSRILLGVGGCSWALVCLYVLGFCLMDVLGLGPI